MGPTKIKQAGAGKNGQAGRDTVATVEAKGEVDREAIAACDFLLAQAVDHAKNAVLDLSDATYVDYKAAPLLVARRRVLKARGGELAVVAGKAEVRNILRAAAGAEIPVFVTLEEAMSYVKGEGDLVGATAGRADRKAKTKR